MEQPLYIICALLQRVGKLSRAFVHEQRPSAVAGAVRPQTLSVAVGQPAGAGLVLEHHILVRVGLVSHKHLSMADVALLVALHHLHHVLLLMLVVCLAIAVVGLHLVLLLVVVLAHLVLHRVAAILVMLLHVALITL